MSRCRRLVVINIQTLYGFNPFRNPTLVMELPLELEHPPLKVFDDHVLPVGAAPQANEASHLPVATQKTADLFVEACGIELVAAAPRSPRSPPPSRPPSPAQRTGRLPRHRRRCDRASALRGEIRPPLQKPEIAQLLSRNQRLPSPYHCYRFLFSAFCSLLFPSFFFERLRRRRSPW